MSVNSTNPGTLFGGTWAQITGRFLLAAGGGYSAGATGGEATHKLTVAEMPNHNHTIKYGTFRIDNWNDPNSMGLIGNNEAGTVSSNSSGGSTSHNNMPPYYVVYIWKRTA